MSDIAPADVPIQQESVAFNQPVSESTLTAVGALANNLRMISPPIGTILMSMLDESTFQAQNHNPTPEKWILCDGRDVTGSTYQTLTGQTTVPDLRGCFARGKNNGRADGHQNPDGDLSLGAYTDDRMQAHEHSTAMYGEAGTSAQFFPAGGTQVYTGATQGVINARSGADTAPKSVTVNFFIRIN